MILAEHQTLRLLSLYESAGSRRGFSRAFQPALYLFINKKEFEKAVSMVGREGTRSRLSLDNFSYEVAAAFSPQFSAA